MSFGPVAEADWLRESLGDERLAVVDCRWRLGDPGAGVAAYEAGHVPGAAFLDLDTELAAPPGEGGRHPLPAAHHFAAALARAGVGARSRVVAYDEAGEGGAVRLWWLLRHFGHAGAAVLDGGLRAWREAGGALEPGAAEPRPALGEPWTARPRDDDIAEADELLAGAPGLVDARAPERFRGEVEPIDPVAGHIPGARNVPFAELAPDGRYGTPEDLRARLEAVAGPEGELVAYCGSGVTSAHVVLAAELAGLPPARLYPGSWSEWSRRGLPVERG